MISSTYYTIAVGDVGNRVVHAFGRDIDTSDITGRIGPHDIGRRVFAHSAERAVGLVHYSVESDSERTERIAAYLSVSDWVRVSETIRHGNFRSNNIVGGNSLAAASKAVLSVSPYNSGIALQQNVAGNSAKYAGLLRDLANHGHAGLGWAYYDLVMD